MVTGNNFGIEELGDWEICSKFKLPYYGSRLKIDTLRIDLFKRDFLISLPQNAGSKLITNNGNSF
jgi:hypothetical protein